MYTAVINEFPYMESSIRDYSKKFLLKSLQFGSQDDFYIQHTFLLDDLYIILHDQYDERLPISISLKERWDYHLELDEILVREDLIYCLEQPGCWMEQTYDYPTEQMVDDGFLNSGKFAELMDKVKVNWPINLSPEDLGI